MKKILLLLFLFCLQTQAQEINWTTAIQDGLISENDQIELCNGSLNAFNSSETNIENSEYILTICPSNDNEVVFLSEIDVDWIGTNSLPEGFSLAIYNGSDTNAPILASSTPLNSSMAEGLSSNNESGCITIEYKTGSTNIPPNFPAPAFGFSLLVNCNSSACPLISPIVNINETSTCASQISNSFVVSQNEILSLEASAIINGQLASNSALSFNWTINNEHFENQNIDLSYDELGVVIGSLVVYDENYCQSESVFFNIIVSDDQLTISPQDELFSLDELITEILVGGGDCANVNNINSPIQSPEGTSIGYFNKGCSDFPFDEGVVLGTGGTPGIVNIGGENAWFESSGGGNGPNEQLLAKIAQGNDAIGNVNDVSAIEFEFNSFESEVDFNYIFASYEYPSFICNYADTFGFIISGPYDVDGNYIGDDFEDGTPGVYQDEYLYNHNANPDDDLLASNLGGLNIATVLDENNNLVPTTSTNIHDNSDCSSSSGAMGEFYLPQFFNQLNPSYHNINGETVVLNAHAEVIPCTTYKMKLLIGDWNDTLFNSFVFLEGGSFGIGADLGDDLIPGKDDLVCFGETQNLSIYKNEIDSNCELELDWFLEGELVEDFSNQYSVDVTSPGLYEVFIDGDGTCSGSDEIQVQFLPVAEFDYPFESICACNPEANFEIDLTSELDPLSFLNHNGQGQPINSNQNTLSDLGMEINFFESEDDAIQFNNPIQNPSNYEVTEAQNIWIRVNEFSSGEAKCPTIKSIEVLTALAERPVVEEENVQHLDECNLLSTGDSFDLSVNNALSLGANNPAEVNITYHLNRDEALLKINSIQNPENFTLEEGTEKTKVFARLESNQSDLCFSLVSFEVAQRNAEIATSPLINYYECKEENQTTNLVSFNLNDYNEIVLGENQNPSDYQINYFRSEEQANNFSNPILKSSDYTSEGETLWVRISRKDQINECFEIDSFDLIVTEFGDPQCVTFSTIDFETSFSLYPNPTSGKLTIDYSKQFEIERVEIYSLQGKKLFQSNQAVEEINLTEFTAGIYLIRVLVNNHWVTKKVIKE